MYVTYNYNDDSEWESIQKRTLDPYSLLKSDTLNRINSIYGDNIIISGFDLSSLQRDDYLQLILNAGMAIKDSVLIDITEQVSIKLDNYSEEFLDDFADGKEEGLIVLRYKYEKIYPAPQAKIEFIKESEYDPEEQLALYRIVFSATGTINTIIRVIEPKGNVIYEQMLVELQSVAKASVKNALADLGSQDIATLIQCYMRIKGTSISGDYSLTTKYHLLRSFSKYTYKDLLEIRLALNVGEDYYYGKYLMHEIETTNSGVVLDVNSEMLSSVNTDLSAVGKYATIYVYEGDSNFNVYLKLDGNIKGRVEIIETISNDDKVEVLNIENKESTGPNLAREDFVWKSTDPGKKNTNSFVNGYLIWNQSNMGHGSGLDADTLDGKEGSYFAPLESFNDAVTSLEQSIADLKDALNQATGDVSDRMDNLESYFDPVENTDKDKVVLQSEKKEPNGIPTLDENGVVPEDQLDVKVVDGVRFHADDKDPVATDNKRLNIDANLYAPKIFNAAFGDIAECFPCNSDMNMTNCANRIVSLDYNSGKLRLSTRNDNVAIGVVSNTYGVLLKGTQEMVDSQSGIIPVAVCGTVWVMLEEMDSNKNYLGNLVGPGDEGYGRIVTRKQPHIGMIVQVNEGDPLVKVLVRTGF